MKTTPDRAPLAGRVAIGGLILIVLAGAWLFAAPFGLAYQPMGTSWTAATRNDLATGGALILIAAITLIAYAALMAKDLISHAKAPVPAPGGAFEDVSGHEVIAQ